MTCIRCQHSAVKRFGTYGKARIQRFRCTSCNATFTAPRQKPLGQHRLDEAKAVQVVTMLCEGMSVRAISRVTGVHKRTILSLLLTAGEKSRRAFDARIHNVRPRPYQFPTRK
jgi:transposase-like protein